MPLKKSGVMILNVRPEETLNFLNMCTGPVYAFAMWAHMKFVMAGEYIVRHHAGNLIFRNFN